MAQVAHTIPARLNRAAETIEAAVKNEWEFQSAALHWINTVITGRGLALDEASTEQPTTGGKRSDIVIWTDRPGEQAAAEISLKTPATSLADVAFREDAVKKAQIHEAPYIVLWNMREAVLYRTPAYPRTTLEPDDLLRSLGEAPSVDSVDKGSTPSGQKELKDLALQIALSIHDAVTTGSVGGQVIDTTIFVDNLRRKVEAIRAPARSDFSTSLAASKKTSKTVLDWAKKQGIYDFVADIHDALAAQLGYRIAGQVLFYYAFRRQQASLPTLKLKKGKPVLQQLRGYWDRVRVFDYEALYDESPLEEVTLTTATEAAVLALAQDLSRYDWDRIELDVLGAIFEQMIPEPDRVALGQYYTSPHLADVVIALCTESPDDVYLDPGVGTGTFLYRAYDKKTRGGLHDHGQKLDQLWGFDISAFAAELAVINLYRQDLANQSNFPRIAVKDFFTTSPSDALSFPPAKAAPKGPKKVDVTLPRFDVLIGNPPYVRSQQLDDLDNAYKRKLQAVALKAKVLEVTKFDAFAYFIVHSAQFLDPGSRMGYVTSAAWLTSGYGAVLQKFLLDKFQDLVILYSEVEPFFRAEVETVVVAAKRIDDSATDVTSRGTIRFACFTRPLKDLLPPEDSFDYWTKVSALMASVETAPDGEDPSGAFRVSSLAGDDERQALQNAPSVTRNWAVELRRSPIYDDIFG